MFKDVYKTYVLPIFPITPAKNNCTQILSISEAALLYEFWYKTLAISSKHELFCRNREVLHEQPFLHTLIQFNLLAKISRTRVAVTIEI